MLLVILLCADVHARHARRGRTFHPDVRVTEDEKFDAKGLATSWMETSVKPSLLQICSRCFLDPCNNSFTANHHVPLS